MAKGSAIIGKIKGHAGNLVFRVRKGEQIIQTKPGPRGKDHLPTYNQAWNYMRFKWASLMSQVTLELTDHSFTRKYMNQSSTNKFIQANIQNFNPINKKCQNMFDLSVEAPLTFNGIQISTGDMAPVNIVFGTFGANGDFYITGDATEGGTLLRFGQFWENNQEGEQIFTWDTLLSNETMATRNMNWLKLKGIKEGEMLTLVFMTAKGYSGYSSWTEEKELPYGLEMMYIRFKISDDGTQLIVQPSASMVSLVNSIKRNTGESSVSFNIGEKYIVGACAIHSKQIYGGWSCDDTMMNMLDPVTHQWIDNFTWEQNAITLYQNNWSTQEMPILDPASLTEEEQQELRTGRVIQTVNAAGDKIYVSETKEEVTVEGENLEVSEKKKKTRKSTESPEE